MCLTNISQVTRVVSLQWYDGKHGQPQPDSPALVICYDNGRMQIMKNESDEGKMEHCNAQKNA
jgi:WD repeat-containing protein 35